MRQGAHAKHPLRVICAHVTADIQFIPTACARALCAAAIDKLIQPVEVLATVIRDAEAALSEFATTHIFFFSDGVASSDQLTSYSRIGKILTQLKAKATGILAASAKQIIGHLVGFGRDDFAALQGLTRALPGSSFEKIDRNVEALSSSIRTFSSTITTTRLSSVAVRPRNVTLRPVLLEKGAELRFSSYKRCNLFLSPDMEDLTEHGFDLPDAKPDAYVDLEISDGALEKGGERNVFNMHFASHERYGTLKDLANDTWVVKENKISLVEGRPVDQREFHKKSLITQAVAEFFSGEFNKEVAALGLSGVPKVAFMKCCYIETAGEPRRNLFAEKHLCGVFRKWNSNSGHVFVYQPKSESSKHEASSAATVGDCPTTGGGGGLGAITEDDEEAWERPEAASPDVVDGVSTDDVAQAFSHWSYTKPVKGPNGERGRLLGTPGPQTAFVPAHARSFHALEQDPFMHARSAVCDIQGAFNEKEQTFRLIDPVVHSSLGKKSLFGATDCGEKGIHNFFASHRCNRVCELLQLPKSVAQPMIDPH